MDQNMIILRRLCLERQASLQSAYTVVAKQLSMCGCNLRYKMACHPRAISCCDESYQGVRSRVESWSIILHRDSRSYTTCEPLDQPQCGCQHCCVLPWPLPHTHFLFHKIVPLFEVHLMYLCQICMQRMPTGIQTIARFTLGGPSSSVCLFSIL